MAIAYVSLWATAPVLAFGTTYRLLAVASVLLWGILEVMRKDGVFIKPTAPVVMVFIYVAYTLLIEYATDRNYTSLFQSYIFMFFVLVYVSRRYRISSLRSVFWLIVLTLPIWLLKTYQAFDSIDSNIARTIVKSAEGIQELTDQGLGGYGLVYSMVLLMPVLVTMVIRSNQLNYKIPRLSPTITRPVFVGVLVLNVVLGTAVIFRAGYTIAVVLTGLSVLATFVVRRRTLGHLLLVGVSGVILFYAVMDNLSPMLQQLVPVVEGTAYAPKVADMIRSLELDAAKGTVEGRYLKYWASIAAFLDSPLVGSLSSEDVGGHSAILDRLGRYGIIVAGIFSYLYLHSLIRLMRIRSGVFSMLYGTFFAAIILAMLNTVSGMFGVTLFILIPASCAMMSKVTVERNSGVTTV